ncbi:hypothetical protein [Actinomadura keratinilytica]|uniref:hypothetical protein n=1 Tax=Actinomadura keratinilytica TaxID=547461 RepID=UPI0036142729
MVHLAGLALLIGSATAFDLRLLGVSRALSVRTLGTHLLRWTWTGFALAAASGLLLFSANATALAANTAFQVKLAVIALAGCNAAVFHTVHTCTIASWDTGAAPPPLVRLTGAASLLLWLTAPNLRPPHRLHHVTRRCPPGAPAVPQPPAPTSR